MNRIPTRQSLRKIGFATHVETRRIWKEVRGCIASLGVPGTSCISFPTRPQSLHDINLHGGLSSSNARTGPQRLNQPTAIATSLAPSISALLQNIRRSQCFLRTTCSKGFRVHVGVFRTSFLRFTPSRPLPAQCYVKY